MQWCRKKLKSLFPKGHRQLCYVDDWDPELNEIQDAEDAWSGEEYFRHTAMVDWPGTFDQTVDAGTSIQHQRAQRLGSVPVHGR